MILLEKIFPQGLNEARSLLLFAAVLSTLAVLFAVIGRWRERRDATARYIRPWSRPEGCDDDREAPS